MTKSLTLCIRNEGNLAVTLSKTLANCNPSSLQSYLTLNWNYGGQTIIPSATLAVTLSLTVASNTPATSSFGFDTIITAQCS
jgi:hypothetical protein